MSIYINHSTNDVSTNAGGKVTSGGNSVITSADAATDAAVGIVELATSAEVQTGTDTGRVPSVSSLRGGLLVSGTAIATTSGTSHDFTGIPAWVQRVDIIFNEVSTNGTVNRLVQLGDSGGIETSGYLGAGSLIGSTVGSTLYAIGFGIRLASATDTWSGIISLLKISGNTWVASGVLSTSNAANTLTVAGSKTLTGDLTTVRITTVNGTDTFDAGSVNIIYE